MWASRGANVPALGAREASGVRDAHDLLFGRQTAPSADHSRDRTPLSRTVQSGSAYRLGSRELDKRSVLWLMRQHLDLFW